MKKITLMLVDDHFIVRAGLAGSLALEPEIRVVAECGTGEEAVEAYGKWRPDVVIMDWRLPGINGVEATARIRTADPEAKVVILSSYEGQEDIHRAVEAGAAGYLSKSVRRRELLSAIRKVHAGGTYFPEGIMEKLNARNAGLSINDKELAVLRLIARGFSNKEIGVELEVAEVTVKFHVGAILRKLGAADRTQAAMMALQRGILHLE